MRYRILGVTQAEDDQGTGRAVGGPRLRALLTALALRPGRVTAPQTLIAEVWADDPPEDAPAALQALVGRLRRALGKDTVTLEPGGYRLAATEDDVDLFVFESLVRTATAALDRDDARTASHALDEALALWHGPALADLPDRTAAARPDALRLEALRARAEARLRLGHAQDVVPDLTELTTAHPYDEPLHALLIRALRDTGRPADALAAYESARRTLADTFGTDPGPELKALHASLLKQEPPAPAPAPTRPPERTGNLRPRLTSFVGREPELEAIRSDLYRARLVTLTGPGGSGKTRLAEEAAAGLPQAWLVELAPLDRPEAVPGAVVSALGLRETVLLANDLATPQADPTALLIEYCAPRSQLLILDNCEHVIGAAAALAETLLTHCPGLTVLATSREPLGVPGESVRPVEPLVPEQAHRLFAERAQAVRPDADAVLRDTEAVAEICRRLDGLPLAIELAAARLRLLTPRQIADRLDDRFRLLTSGSRTVLPRQQTLRAVVDWSWDLLDERERTMLREVSVFAGGWDLTAAEAVCTGPAAELIGALVDKSLVVAAPDGSDSFGGMRYRMLETIHEYATERTAEFPELRVAAERRHRAWVRALVEQAEPQLRSAAQLPWIGRLEGELDNIRAALDRTLRAGDEAEAGAIVLAIGWFWWLRNYRQEAVEWVRQVLRLGVARDALPEGAAQAALTTLTESADPVGAFLAAPDGEAGHPLRELRMDLRMLDLFLTSETSTANLTADERAPQYIARVRAGFEHGGPQAARLPGIVWPLTAYYLGGPVDLEPDMAAAVANCRRHGGDWEIGVSLMYRTHMVVDSPGNLRGVDEDLAELRALSRRAGDRWMRAQVCSAAGEAAMARGRFEEARGEYEEALRLAYEVGAYAESPFLMARLADIAYRSGDRAGALAALDEAGTAADRYGVAESRAFVLMMRAHIAVSDGDLARARELYEATCTAAAGGTPPPQFTAALCMVEALLTAGESGPRPALPIVAEALREAVERRCAESVTAGLVDIGADLLARLGDLAGAVRLFAAAEHWRAGHPRPEPERTRAERIDTEARAELPADRYAAERARGASFTPEDVLRELEAPAITRAGGPR
ncbi:BTAD domain-containing putative transcriptional regulator [Streptomyces diastatochromogenes]|uniref:AfsR family transcriptional regulator n=1 Tax=Streptomyces diastatochromogenes TaxID=42236 RepID=A0A233RXZ3_STRDA|nr:BTAD domain-containing putative transcriptional regulator [Streptomyces diastatochromogenes]OXY88272.1 AfsR family transcriptional regulator [Streptomyces diastatochromogenes]